MGKDKIMEIIKKSDGKNPKKKIENLIVFVIILIITIVAINYILGGKEKQNTTNQTETSYKKLADTTKEQSTNSTQGDELEKKLENILSKIEGVGDVNVLITYSQSSEVVAMYNESSKTSNTKESDAEGGTRDITEADSTKEVIYTEENGVNVPVTQTVINPKIEGALITAKGANNSQIKANIIQAVEAVTGLATHKVQVFEMNS